MHWCTVLPSAWLFGLNICGVFAGAQDGGTPPKPPATTNDEFVFKRPAAIPRTSEPPSPEYVYRADSRAPRELRRVGGLRPWGRGWENDDWAYVLPRHYIAAPFGDGLEEMPYYQSPDRQFRTAYVSLMRNLHVVETIYSGTNTSVPWLYEIRATQNILDYGDYLTECFALGGVPWHQIRSYRLNRAGSEWQLNPDYATTFYEDMAQIHLYRVTHISPNAPDFDHTFPATMRDGLHGGLLPASQIDGLRAAAAQWVNGQLQRYVPGSWFPFIWVNYPEPDFDIPGPGQATPLEPGAGMDEQRPDEVVTRLAATDLAVQVALNMNPSTRTTLRNWAQSRDQAGCSFWNKETSPISTSQKRDSVSHLAGRKSARDEVKCAKLYIQARMMLLDELRNRSKAPLNEAERDSPLAANELQSLRDGNFTQLDCKDLLGKVVYHRAKLRHNVPLVPKLARNEDYCQRTLLMHQKSLNKTLGGPEIEVPKSYVFYSDYLWPDEAKRQGGFLPMEKTAKQYDEIGWRPHLLKAFSTFGPAAKRAMFLASRATKGHSGVVYLVHTTPNVVSWGTRATIVGGIRWSQVVAWRQLPEDYEERARRPAAPPDKAKQINNFRDAFLDMAPLMTRNADYDDYFDRFQASTSVPQEILHADDLKTFMDHNGHAVGWNGSFPLFTPNSGTVTTEASRAAKAAHNVSAPHPESTWESMKSFADRHTWALMALPAVIVANLIPGVGEVADAAEMAALAADTCEAIEMEQAMPPAMTRAGQGLARLLQGVSKDL